MRPRPGFAPILAALLCVWSSASLAAAPYPRPRPPWLATESQALGPALGVGSLDSSTEQLMPDLLQTLVGEESSPVRDAIAAPLWSSLSLPQDAAWEGWLSPGPASENLRVVEWQGKLVLAGNLRAAGSTACNSIALWDGTDFETLPDPGSVQFVTVWNDQLVVAVSGPAPNYHLYSVKRFNGSTWDPLGVTNGYPYCMEAFGDQLVIGGQFTAVDGVGATNIAVFDGDTWAPLGAGLSPRVECVGEYNGTIFAGGPFNLGLQAWNSTLQLWEPKLDAISVPQSITSDGQYLYVAGERLTSGGSPQSGLMRWDGANWTAIPGTAGRSCRKITIWNGRVIATISQPPVGRLSQWDGVSLTAVPGDSIGYGLMANSLVTYLGTWGPRLVATGTFSSNGYALVPHVAIYDGNQWSTVGVPWDASMRSPSGPIHNMRVWSGKLVVATAGALVADLDHYKFTGAAAVFDGAHWEPLSPNTIFAQYRYLTEWNGDLVTYGYNLSIGGTTIRNIARWDGTNWHPFGSGGPTYVDAAIEFQGQLYAADGSFLPNGITRWNGTSWLDVGGGTPGGAPWALCVHGNSLVAGGVISMAGVTPVNNIAVWDGTSWSALGDGLSGGPVDAVASWNGLIVAGGRFTSSGAQPIVGMAYWDGSSWHQMGTNAIRPVYVSEYYGELFASGTFRLPDNSEVFTLAKWNGTDWHLLGSGTNQGAFAFYGDHLYGAGSGLVHGHVSHGLSRVPISAVLDAPRPEPRASSVALSASPNPARGHMDFAFTLPSSGTARLSVLDVSGRIVATLVDGAVPAGEHRAEWNSAPAPGIYFARLDLPGGAQRVLRVARVE